MPNPPAQVCPICSSPVEASPRYPHYLCDTCAGEAADERGRPLVFYNVSMSGGFMAKVRETGEVRDSHVCFVRGTKCWANEAHFGGIVIEPSRDK